ncbi:MAG: class I SAM-dependent methyltransferase [Candidatus Bathyarchaeia archaeon]|jgi:ubiquinone/menaquinone biosynthesis C-methylase UbiE
MGCHGGFTLDDATRRSWYNPEAILQDLSSGMVFIDIGSADGFFSILAAKKVGKNGKVYAVDADASAIEKLKNKAKAENLKNITATVGEAEETIFCIKCADFIFYSMVLHDFADPTKVLKNANQMIKPNGHLINLDWKKIDMPLGPPARIRFSREKASSLIQAAGFQIDTTKEAGNYHYLIIAKPSP